MRTIVLTKGKYAIVDDMDYKRVSTFQWQALKTKNNWYAYRMGWINKANKHISMHRFILDLEDKDKCLVDHKDSDGLNNRRSNLRVATCQQNSQHSKKHTDAIQSIHKGVYWEEDRKAWRAYIYLNKKKIWLGRFVKEIDAAKAYNNKAKELFGCYALLNNIL